MVSHPKSFSHSFVSFDLEDKKPERRFLLFSAAQSFELIRWSIYSANVKLSNIILTIF